MPRTKTTSKTTATKKVVEETKPQSELTNIVEETSTMTNEILTTNGKSTNNYVNINNASTDQLTNNLHLLEESTGIKSALLVERILNDALSNDGSFHLISLFRNILNDEKLKLKESQLEALEMQKKQQLLIYKEKELEALKYSLMV